MSGASLQVTICDAMLCYAMLCYAMQVTGFGGKITLDNTLQSRLMLAYETRLPQLMKVLFQ